MIITIDGPTASGKSTVARGLANKLGIYYLSTGMLYRALGHILTTTFGYTEEQLRKPNMNDVRACINPQRFTYEYDSASNGVRILFDGADITELLKTREADNSSSIISVSANVRAAVLEFQRSFGQKQDLVAEGRDTGSTVFPDAQVKFFLTASLDERGRRWQQFQKKKGQNFSLAQSEKLVHERDERDRTRKVAPLVVPNGAFVIDNTGLSVEQTLERFVDAIKEHA